MASRFPAAWLDELRSRADIVQVIQSYVPLKRNGHRYWGLCPFHGEKTASFSVDKERQLYYCFGCKASGTVIQFVMDMEHLTFPEAVKFLADQQHLPLPQMENDPEYQRKREYRDRLLEANLEAARFYRSMLFEPGGKASLDYLKNRGLSDSVIKKFGLGAAPDDWDALTRHLTGKGFSIQELKQAGLTVVKEEETLPDGSKKPQRVFDMFRARAMFPIIDQYGNVLAFGGRMLAKGQPKYLNTSDTPVFNKRLGVFAANLLRKERNLDHVILVEGYMDVVALTQFGIPGVCATLGTALTPEQAKLLKRFAPKVYLAYDGDSAGQHAILRGLDILQAEGIPCRVLDFPDGQDPDEFIRDKGIEGFNNLAAISPETYRLRRMKEQFDLSTQEGRTEYAKAAADIIRSLEPVELENHLQELMVQTGFTRDVLMAQIGIAPAAPQTHSKAPVQARPVIRSAGGEDLRAQELLISLAATGRIPSDVMSEEDFEDPLLKRIFLSLSEGRSPASLVEEQETEQARARVSSLLLTPPGDDKDQLIRMTHECLTSLRLKRVEKRLNEIMLSINSLSGDEKLAAMKEVAMLTARRNELKIKR